MEQGASLSAGKMQNALLKNALPLVHCHYEGPAARHINTVGNNYIITVNSDNTVDVFRRGQEYKLKTLNIEVMRCSLTHNDVLLIGTEERMLYMIDTVDFEIVDRV
jgi:hypothetical protein